LHQRTGVRALSGYLSLNYEFSKKGLTLFRLLFNNLDKVFDVL
jgi:hypothetical protein